MPQVIIAFDGQSASHLVFTVTLVRIVTTEAPSLEEMMQHLGSNWEFTLDRMQIVGHIDKGHPKEAAVFQLKLEKQPSFLRLDFSINLFEARQQVIDLLTEKLGEIRDYTGGMLLKQHASFSQFRENFQDTPNINNELLEDFFYSITPIEAQATLPLEATQTLFELFIDLRHIPETKEQFLLKKQISGIHAFIMLRFSNSDLKKSIESKINRLALQRSELVTTQTKVDAFHYIGFIYSHDQDHEANTFCEQLEGILKQSFQEDQQKQELRFGFHIYPSLDPRIPCDVDSTMILKMLHEGLMRINADGQPECALAESYTASSDGKTYTFHLRDCKWSNGNPITAYDFAYTWKQVLSPAFTTSFAYLFYPIRHAKAAKKGEIPLDAVGVAAADERTLIVQLEHPFPYFLQLMTLNLFYPINHRIDQCHPDWSHHTHPEYACSGPFILKEVNQGKSIELAKNPFYREAEKVKLKKVSVTVASLQTLMKMYEKKKIDLFKREKFTQFRKYSAPNIPANELQSLSNESTKWLAVNTDHPLLKLKKIRQAFSMALNREEFCQHLWFPISLPKTLIPNMCSTQPQPVFEYNLDLARSCFQEALHEIGMNITEFPHLTILCSEEEKESRKELLECMQIQLKKAFGISLGLDFLPWNTVLKRMRYADYHFIFLRWINLINTPNYLLDAFRSPEKDTFYKWNNRSYQTTLEQAYQEKELDKHREKLADAENILMDELPVIPLYHERETFICTPVLKDCIDNNDDLDLREAYFDRSTENPNDSILWR